MLYREGQRLTKEDLADHVEILKQKFPSFFRKSGALPIFYNYAKHRMRSVDLFTPGGETRVGNRLIAPTPKGIKSVGYDIEDGFKVEVVYSKSAPVYSGGDYRFPSLNIKLAHSTKLDPKTDLELLIFLWFYCPEFQNNDCSYKKDNADFIFVIPEAEVEHKYDKITSRRRFEDEILIPQTRISFDAVKAIMAEMGLSIRNEERVDRITLFDVVSNSKGAQDKYLNIKKGVAPESPKAAKEPEVVKTVEDVLEVTNIKNRIVSMIEDTKIYNDGVEWKIKTGGKPKAICKVEGAGEEEEIFNLIEYVSTNSEVQAVVEKYAK